MPSASASKESKRILDDVDVRVLEVADTAAIGAFVLANRPRKLPTRSTRSERAARVRADILVVVVPDVERASISHAVDAVARFATAATDEPAAPAADATSTRSQYESPAAAP